MFAYDFKFDDLSKIAYNQYLQNKHRYEIESKFYVINFDDLSRNHCYNPLDVSIIHDITDATD